MRFYCDKVFNSGKKEAFLHTDSQENKPFDQEITGLCVKLFGKLV